MQLLVQQRSDDLVVAYVTGEVQLEGSLELQRTLLAEVERGYHTVLIDLSATQLLASPALSAIVNVYRKLHEIEGRLALCGASGVVERAIETSRFQDLFAVYKDETQALEAMREEEEADR